MKFSTLLILVFVVLAVFSFQRGDASFCGGCECDISHCNCKYPAEKCREMGVPIFGEKYTYDGRYKNDITMSVDNEIQTKVLMASKQLQFNGYLPTLNGGYVKYKNVLGQVFQRLV